MHASSSLAARRGVSERVAAFHKQESFGSFTAEDSDVFQSKSSSRISHDNCC